MPRIPTITNDIQATTRLRSPRASASTFGRRSGQSAIGQALVGVGQDIGAVADMAAKHEARRNDLRASLEFVKFKGEERQRFAEEQQSAEAGAPEFTRSYAESFDERADAFLAERVPDDQRDEMRLRLAQFRNSQLGQATTFEAKSRAFNLKQETQDTLDTLLNGVRVDPRTYSDALDDGLGIIDAIDAPGDLKTELRTQFEEQLANTHFESRIGDARSEAALDEIEAELESEPWQERLNPADYERLQAGLRTQRGALARLEQARAKAVFDSVKGRMEEGIRVDPAEIGSVDAIVRQSGDPDLIRRWEPLKEEYLANRQARKMSPGQARTAAQRLRAETKTSYKGFAPRVAELANQAGRVTGIGASYFVNLLRREAAADELAQRKTGVRNLAGDSSATGLYQFVDATWLELIKETGAKYGIDVAGKSDAELLAMRGDAETSTKMAIEFTQRNRRALRASLGYEPSHAELYMAHFLGAGGAAKFIKARFDDPKGAAAKYVKRSQARANRTIFYVDGDTSKPRTVEEVYRRVERSFASSVPERQYVRLQGVESALAAMEKARKPGGDIMSFAADADVIALADLNAEGGFAERGRQAMEMKGYYGLSYARPLTDAEVDQLSTRFEEGTISEKLALLDQLQQLGPGAAAGAYRQLGDKNQMLGNVAYLAERDRLLAGKALRGAQRIAENKDIRQILKEPTGGTARVFNDYVGRSMNAAPPRQRQALREMVDAVYIERYGGSTEGFDESDYEAIVQQVVGAVGEVNGERMLLPPGVPEGQMEDAIDLLTDDDLLELSDTGEPPVFIDGDPVTAEDIRNEGRFVALRSGRYQITMADGNPVFSDLRTGRQYGIRLDQDTVTRLLERRTRELPSPSAGARPVTPGAVLGGG